MHADHLRSAAASAGFTARNANTSFAPKVGDAIFEGTDYPRRWEDFVGQRTAIDMLRAACFAAEVHDRRLPHILLATGLHGVGKTSLAKLIAASMGVGIVEVSGKISAKEIRAVLKGMEHNDILFIDEIHQLVSGGKANAEWLLHLLQDGVLMTARGPEQMPKVTVVAATTDKQKLPETILSRFPYQPVLEGYTDEEAATIAEGMAAKLGFDNVLLPAPSKETLAAIARAANNGPRDIKGLLTQLRDAATCKYAMADEAGTYDLTTLYKWAGVTYDGLNTMAQDFLCVLLTASAHSDSGCVSLKNLGSIMGEPGPLEHTEKLLLQKGYITVQPRGRQLTEVGVRRTIDLLAERGLLEEVAA